VSTATTTVTVKVEVDAVALAASLASALRALADSIDPVLDAPEPDEVVDGDGDVWTRGTDGLYRFRPGGSGRTLDFVREHFGSLEGVS
jgi:hypothetical protein